MLPVLGLTYNYYEESSDVVECLQYNVYSTLKIKNSWNMEHSMQSKYTQMMQNKIQCDKYVYRTVWDGG